MSQIRGSLLGPLRTPLILVEERGIDPTLPSNIVEEERDAGSWWMNSSADLDSAKMLSDENWVASKDGIPAFDNLLSVVEHDGQDWRLLASYPSWGKREENANWDASYRQVWIYIQGYFIQKLDIATAYSCLHRRNFFGRWMPESATYLYGFAGEYPWGTPFNTEPEEPHSLGRERIALPYTYTPCWNQLAVEWQYDASIPRNFHMFVPARTFFSPGDLWWDGKDGYRLTNGRTIFRDPSVTEVGPAALIVDATELLSRLDKLGMCLMWTLLGEKWLLGGFHDKPTPRRTFSQIARLKEDGSLHIGERVFFDDYDTDTGPK